MHYHWGLTVRHQSSHATAQTYTRNLGNTHTTASDESDGDGESYHISNQVESHASDHEDEGEPGMFFGLESERSEAHKDSVEDMYEQLAMEDMYGDSHKLKCYD
jgi:hypothetical protein